MLVITLQKQSTTVYAACDRSEPTTCSALGCTGPARDDNGYGVAPYLGLSVSLFEGYGAPAADPFPRRNHRILRIDGQRVADLRERSGGRKRELQQQ